MTRIAKAYEAKFRALLKHVRARRLNQGVEWMLGKAHEISAREGVPMSAAFTRLHDRLAAKPGFCAARPGAAPSRFFCDAGLGGLARWLRAAGYELVPLTTMLGL